MVTLFGVINYKKDCSKYFTSKYALSQHRGERNFPCQFCNKTFFAKSHKRAHEFICEKLIEKQLIKETEDYNNIFILRGKIIYNLLQKNKTLKEEALSKGKRKALKMYIEYNKLNEGKIFENSWKTIFPRKLSVQPKKAYNIKEMEKQIAN